MISVTPQSHRGHTVRKFNRLLGRLGQDLKIDLRSLPIIYPVDAVVRRWLQRFDEVAFDEFAMTAVREYEAGRFVPDADDAINRPWAGVTARGETQLTIRLSPKRLLRELGFFFAYWGYILLHVMRGTIRGWLRRLKGKPALGAATVSSLIGRAAIEREGSDRRFVEFCRNGPVAPLCNARRLLVQSEAIINATEPAWVSYPRFPLGQLWEDNPPGTLELVRFLASHLTMAIRFTWLCLRLPALALLARDYAFHPMIAELNRRRLIENVIINVGNFETQFMWMVDLPDRQFQLHFLWYSQNVRWHVYKRDPIEWDDPHYRYLRADHFWIWVESIVPWIRHQGVPGECHVVGPLLWYLPENFPESVEKRPVLEAQRPLTIAVFDITPVNAEWERARGFLAHYYGTANAIQFLRDVVDVSQAVGAKLGREVVVRLKHKRAFASFHDRRYIDFVRQLEAETDRLEIVPSEYDLYEFIRDCDAVVSIPYSSPNYVAACMRRSALFYDPTEQLQPYRFAESEISFASGRDELFRYLHETLQAQGASGDLNFSAQSIPYYSAKTHADMSSLDSSSS